MYCLSVRQPWADFIVRGFKPFENRTWRTAYRGPLLIHAGKTFDETHDICPPLIRAGDEWIIEKSRRRRGMIVGVVNVTGCVDHSDSPWFCGPFALRLENARCFEMPIEWPGQLKLFDVPDEVVREQLDLVG